MKSQRQAKILEIISNKNVETQEQLLAELQEAGFRGTQATISRDIKELRIVKELTSQGTYRYSTSSNELSGTFSARLNTIFRECVVSFDYAQNLIVIRTLPGLANAAASAIDSMNMSTVVGSLAGDDTVMIVMRDMNAAATFCGEIRNLLNSNPDYATFIEATQLGQDINAKLLALLDIIDGTIVSSINSITGKIDVFLNRQEELNQKNF